MYEGLLMQRMIPICFNVYGERFTPLTDYGDLTFYTHTMGLHGSTLYGPYIAPVLTRGI